MKSFFAVLSILAAQVSAEVYDMEASGMGSLDVSGVTFSQTISMSIDNPNDQQATVTT